MSIPTVETPVALPPKAADRIRMASFGALTMLVIQFVLGTAYSLYGTAPTTSKSVGMFSSPLLAIHVIIGILLIIAAIMLVVRAIQARHTPSIAATVAGLLVILGAFGAGCSLHPGRQQRRVTRHGFAGRRCHALLRSEPGNPRQAGCQQPMSVAGAAAPGCCC